MPKKKTAVAPTRAVRLIDAPASTMEVRQRWAIIVGISKYKDRELNLRHADRDAQALYDLIRTPRGGGFDQDRIVRLIDEEATTASLTKAFRSFLKKPAREDLVLIFFACHGAPDPERPGNVYLITHDTDPDDVAGTAMPMEHIQQALEPRNLLAERVILIADTCHSAALGGSPGQRRAIGENAAANRYLQSLSEATPGLAVLTSAEVNETSLEDARWGGGHGVFTYHLLEGIRGKAENDSGIVTVGALFDYVREAVRKDTGDQQHPVIGSTAFDRDLPLAVTGDISANDYLQLGRNLIWLGRLLDDRRRYRSAARQLEEALRFAGDLGQPLPEARLYLGQARLAAGDTAGALCAFEQASSDLDGALLAETQFYRIMARVKLNESQAALDDLDGFLAAFPADWRAAWLQEVKSTLQASLEPGTGIALLIGIGKYGANRYPDLAGPPNDLDLAEELLVTRYGFIAGNIVRLQDEQATQQRILAALDALSQRSWSAAPQGDGLDVLRQGSPNDKVVVWYSGHAITTAGFAYLLPCDFEVEQGRNGIRARELHDLLLRIPATRKVVVLDTHAQQEMIDLARQAGAYTLALAEDRPGGGAEERSIDGRAYGLFSYELIRILNQKPDAPLAEISALVIQAITAHGSKQVPLLVGNTALPLMADTGLRRVVEAFETSLRRNFDAITLDELQALAVRVDDGMQAPYPPLSHSLGRGFIAKEAFSPAREKLGRAKEQAQQVGYVDPDLLLALTIAQLRDQHYADALQTIHEYLGLAAEQSPALTQLTAVMERASHRQIHALLVGVSEQEHESLPAAQGARGDITEIKRLLQEHLGATDANITLLTGMEAKAAAIGDAFSALLAKAQHEPALFYFAGNGSFTSDGQPTILASDSRRGLTPNDILLRDLAQQAAQNATNLVAIIDAGWAAGEKLPWGEPKHCRNVAPDIRTRPATRSLGATSAREPEPVWKPDPEWQHLRHQIGQAVRTLQIGRVTIYPASIQAAFTKDSLPPGVTVAEAEFPSPFDELKETGSIRGVLTTKLIEATIRVLAGGSTRVAPTGGDSPPQASTAETPITYASLLEVLSEKLQWLQPVFAGAKLGERLLSNVVQEEQVQETIRREVFAAPLRQTEEILKRLLDRRNGQGMEAWLNLGIVYAAQNDFESSINALQTSIDQDAGGSPELAHEAHYHLGRVLTLSARAPDAARPGNGEPRALLDQAASELRAATRGDPENAAAHYYLGLAIQTRIEQEQLVEVEREWQIYLDLDAPLGQKEEVKEFLAARRAFATGTGSGGMPGTMSGSGTGAG